MSGETELDILDKRIEQLRARLQASASELESLEEQREQLLSEPTWMGALKEKVERTLAKLTVEMGEWRRELTTLFGQLDSEKDVVRAREVRQEIDKVIDRAAETHKTIFLVLRAVNQVAGSEAPAAWEKLGGNNPELAARFSPEQLPYLHRSYVERRLQRKAMYAPGQAFRPR